MTKKPKGPKFKNLTRRGSIIYFEAVLDGQRVRFSTEETEWDRAAETRDAYLRKREVRRLADRAGLTFAALAARYLAEGMGHLAGTTADDRRRLLGPDGPLVRVFGATRAADLGRADVLGWYQREMVESGRADNTGRQYLAALAGAFAFGIDLDLLAANPVDEARSVIRRRRRTKAGRAAAGSRIHPLETPEDVHAFVAASRRAYDMLDGGQPVRFRQLGHVADVLLLDAGLRVGEAAGLRWRDIEWGTGPDDERRALRIRESLSRGKHSGTTKSGRERTAGLSRRLRSLLREWHLACGRPAPEARVLEGFDPYAYQMQHFERVWRAAGIGRRTPKDLRDSFASHLMTCGVQLAYVSAQLGHSDVATTARHYARWCGGSAYRRPLEVAAGEVPADLLARLEVSPHESPHAEEVGAS